MNSACRQTAGLAGARTAAPGLQSAPVGGNSRPCGQVGAKRTTVGHVVNPPEDRVRLACEAHSPAERPVPMLIFDGDCAFCTTSVGWLSRRLRRGDGTDPEILPWQQADLEALGLDAGQVSREVVWIDAGGQRHGGSAALTQWLRHREGGHGVVGRMIEAPVVRQVAAAVYRLVAMNRHRLPGGRRACALPRS